MAGDHETYRRLVAMVNMAGSGRLVQGKQKDWPPPRYSEAELKDDLEWIEEQRARARTNMLLIGPLKEHEVRINGIEYRKLSIELDKDAKRKQLRWQYINGVLWPEWNRRNKGKEAHDYDQPTQWKAISDKAEAKFMQDKGVMVRTTWDPKTGKTKYEGSY